VLVRNRFSLISAGTERMVVEAGGHGLLTTARRRPDLVRRTLDMAVKQGVGQTIETVRARLDTPVALGYSCAGDVLEVGSEAREFESGQLVACAGTQYANHAEFIAVPRNLCVAVPEGVSALAASFVTVGAIAVHGVRVADVRLGESVAVIGLGLVGQLTVQVLKAAGCRVFGIDLDAGRVAQALQLGADAAVPRNEPGLLEAAAAFSLARGLDAVIVTADTSSSDPLELAGQLARDRAVVSAVGAIGMQVPRSTYYAKELQLRLSRSYGPGRYDREYEEQGIDYPIAYVRWTERRNMEAFLHLASSGVIQPERLVTHRFPVDDAEAAYAILSGKVKEPYLAMVLEYPRQVAPERLVSVDQGPMAAPPTHPMGPTAAVGVGLVGAGNFARSVLIPALRGDARSRLIGVVTGTGLNAQRAARRFGFHYAGSNHHDLLARPDVNAVVVATRHHLHAAIAADALRSGKHVFLEKPMAMRVEELTALLDAWRTAGGILFVGYNRRFAPLAAHLRDCFAQRQRPLSLHYRVNVGPLPANSWIRDPVEGGGAFLSEACHFVDLLHWLVGHPPERVYAKRLGSDRAAVVDEGVAQLEFPDGSVGSITYCTDGDPSVPKERLEVIGDGAVAILDDFVRLTLARRGRTKRLGSRVGRQDKGHRAEVRAFLDAVSGADALKAYTRDAALSTLATLRALDSMRRREPVDLRPEEVGL
jgi:predicted dehydrogenase/threonine dehydrogenase-like Zn-dependent dehydrogenase